MPRQRMITSRRPSKCNRTGKVIFENEIDAKIALTFRQSKEKGEKRYYRCGKHFHLTSQE